MKTIVYFAATLMAGAAIYGFVDYKKTNRDKKFRDLYETKEVVKPRENVKPAPSSKANTIVVSHPEMNKQEETKSAVTPNEKPVIVKKKRKIRAEKFSRAPLDEKYLKEEAKAQSKKAAKVKEKEL